MCIYLSSSCYYHFVSETFDFNVAEAQYQKRKRAESQEEQIELSKRNPSRGFVCDQIGAIDRDFVSGMLRIQTIARCIETTTAALRPAK